MVQENGSNAVINPFYSPIVGDDGDETYEYARYKPRYPEISWAPLQDIEVVDRGLHADPEKKALLAAATKVTHLTPAVGTELEGIDLRQLSNTQKDELALLVAERGVVFLRDQPLNIHEQLELGRYFGPLHKHATTPVPREEGLEEVHVVYNDSAHKPDPSAFSKLELWHSDVTYERQPPGLTSLKVITVPPWGGDTIWSSGYSLFSSLSPAFQEYLSGLTAVHSAVAQAQGARAAGTHVRRQEIETIHPLVRVHPVTGWKSIYINPGFTRRIVGVPKAESDAVLSFLFTQIAQNTDHQVRFRWTRDAIALWDNRIVYHTATFDFWPHRRHALRVTPHGERPLSVKAYEAATGKVAQDRDRALRGSAATESNGNGEAKALKVRGYND